MSTPDLDALYAQAVNQAATDQLVRERFGVEPASDPSGLFTGAPTVPPTPPPSGPQPLPELHQGPRLPAEPGDDPQLRAYMQRYFPGSVTA